MMSVWISYYLNHGMVGTRQQVSARRSSQLKLQLMQMLNPDLCDTRASLLIFNFIFPGYMYIMNQFNKQFPVSLQGCQK